MTDQIAYQEYIPVSYTHLELELDKLGDRKTALFLIMSDTDSTFNFLISMIYTQLFNLLCDKADDQYGGKLPVHVRCLIDELSLIHISCRSSLMPLQRSTRRCARGKQGAKPVG